MASSGATRGGGTIPTQGTAAARPALPNPGQMYWATDTGELSVGNIAGNAWQLLATTSASLFAALNGFKTTTGGNVIQNSANHIQFVAAAGETMITTAGGFDINQTGHGLLIAEGANSKQGVYGPLVAGTLAVANTSVTANSRIFVCRSAGGTNPGAHYVSAQTAGTGFTVTSTNAADTGSGAFVIFEPG